MPDMNTFYLLHFSARHQMKSTQNLRSIYNIVSGLGLWPCTCWYCLAGIRKVVNRGLCKWAGRWNLSHQESYGSLLNHLNLLCKIVFQLLKQTEINKKSKPRRLNQIPEKLTSDPKKKTWQKLTNSKLTS